MGDRREDAWKIPFIVDRAPFAVSPKVMGFVRRAQDWYDLDQVWLKA